MIKSQHSQAGFDAMAKIFFKDIQREFNLPGRLAGRAVDELTPAVQYIAANLREIIIGRPDRLEFHARQLKPLLDAAKTDYGAAHPVINVNGAPASPKKRLAIIKKWAQTELREIFNYDFDRNAFTVRDGGSLAYRHAKRLGMNTCPYCNSSFTFTIKNKRIRTRPQFDHFLDKSRHPYLALSFYNLIPCCPVCNAGGVKGTEVFSSATHIHPFMEHFEGAYRFRTKVDAVDFLVNGADFELALIPVPGAVRAHKRRAKKSIEAFALEDRYKFQKDYAQDVLKKAYVYNNSTLETLFTSFQVNGHSVFASISEVKELVMGNYMHPDSYHKRILSKLTSDIAEEFGLTL